MASYGRNFEFRVPPVNGERGGRYILGGETDLPIGVPVEVDTDAEQSAAYTDALTVELATGASNPVRGMAGILVYELDPGVGLAGLDPVTATYSDYDKAPVGKMVQVVSGPQAKVVFRNTEARTFLQTRDYAGRTMVADIEDISVGDYLTPGAGDDEDGYWATNATAANGWLVVTSVNEARGEVEARLNF